MGCKTEVEEVHYYYEDDYNNSQGPFSADTMQKWFEMDYLKGELTVKITVNGYTEDVLKIKDLKLKYGSKTPFPATSQELIQKEEGETDSDVVYVGDSVKNNSKKIKKESLSPLAGPILPPKFEYDSDRKYDTQSSKSPSAPIDAIRIKNLDYLPFFDGLPKVSREHSLQSNVAVELVSFLYKKYMDLNDRERRRLYGGIKQYKLPSLCNACDSALKQPPNYVSHVLSANHIKKTIDSFNMLFTFTDDYLAMKTMLNDASDEKINEINFNTPNIKQSNSNSVRIRKRNSSKKSGINTDCTTS